MDVWGDMPRDVQEALFETAVNGRDESASSWRGCCTIATRARKRMLTGDPIEAIEQARSFLKKGSVQEYYDEILLGALRLAEADAALGRLDDARLENIHQTVSEIIEDLGAEGAANVTAFEKAKSGSGKIVSVDARKLGRSVFRIPGLGRLDDCAAIVVADFLKRGRIVARIAGAGISRPTTLRRYASAFWRMLWGPGRTSLAGKYLAKRPPQRLSFACWERGVGFGTATTPLTMLRRGH